VDLESSCVGLLGKEFWIPKRRRIMSCSTRPVVHRQVQVVVWT
jgi:hypothetical protein